MSKVLHSLGVLAAVGAVVYTAVHFAMDSKERPNGPRKEKKPLKYSIDMRDPEPESISDTIQEGPSVKTQMSGWTVILKKKAEKDLKELPKYLKDKSMSIIQSLSTNPYAPSDSYEKLTGKGDNMYSKRINIGERVIYEVDPIEKLVYVFRARGHEYSRVNGIDEEENG